MRTMELLAPACSYEGMLGAVNAGADAVYAGGTLYGARAYAENLDTNEFLLGMDYAHLHKKKVYLTLNTLIKERELSTLYSYVKPLYENGLDGVIFQDLGVMKFLREQFPGLPLHASTQLSISDTGGLTWLQAQGCSRVVLARELSISEIAVIHREIPLELEVFIHGALCYSYSGQCLFSSILGGRSGNRGRCAQPCRLPYSCTQHEAPFNVALGHISAIQKKARKEEYLLSLKDLCGIDFLPDLYEAGVASLKIEGRMKRAEYAAGVTEVYRRALDSLYEGDFHISDEDRNQLMDLYSRGGNSAGYFNRQNGREMMTFSSPGYRTGEESLFEELHDKYIKEYSRLPIQGCCRIESGKPSVLTVSFDDTEVTVTGAVAEPAKNKPMEAEEVARRLKKTGETEFTFSSLKIDMEPCLFLPIQSINELRRQGISALKDALLKSCRRKEFTEIALRKMTKNREKTFFNASIDAPISSVLITALEQGNVLFDFPEIKEVTIDAACAFADGKTYHTLIKKLTKAGYSVHLAMPYVFRRKTKQMFENSFDTVFLPEIHGFLVRNLESLQYLRESGFSTDAYTFRSDSHFYSNNSLAQEIELKDGFSRLTLPVELNHHELPDLLSAPVEWIVYSHLPLMITAGCIQAHKDICTKQPGILQLMDRYKKKFPVKNHCAFCYNTIHNGEPMILWDKVSSLKGEKLPDVLRLDFHVEDSNQVRKILQNFREKIVPERDFTRGHFNRGVE